MKKIRRPIYLIIAAVLLLTALSVAVFAAPVSEAVEVIASAAETGASGAVAGGGIPLKDILSAASYVAAAAILLAAVCIFWHFHRRRVRS